MSLTLLSRPFLSFKPPLTITSHSTSSLATLFSSINHPLITYCTSKDGVASENSIDDKFLLDDDLLRRVSGVKGARQVFEVIAESKGSDEPLNFQTSDCNLIIEAAFERGNVELALSLFDAMRLGFVPEDGTDGKMMTDSWRWAQPDIYTYQLLIKGLAAALRVSDAIKIINYVSRVGVSHGEEILFGKIIQCPTCKIAIAVAQPQNGIQVASCSKCRYQYELVSGEIVSIASEEISKDASTWDKALTFLKLKKDQFPAAIHSIVLKTPTGTAVTYRFATKTPNVPAQQGERITLSLSAPSNSLRELGPLKLGPRPTDLKPSQPMCVTNHVTSQTLDLVRPPDSKTDSGLTGLVGLNQVGVIGAVLLVGSSGDFMGGFVDVDLVRFVLGSLVVTGALGAVVNRAVLPELRKLPQKTVDVVAFKQQLLSQYDMLQNRIKDLKQAAEKEVWMLARMSQLENKIIAVGEPSYRARRGRVKRVRENLESALKARIELIESYAKISSMIEIEVEMDSDVLAAEAASNAERISEQIQQIMEIDNLEEQWRIQAEANDEVERLLNSGTMSNESS
ncbi:hypothetical protein LUZ60_001085 [Juncus effusus]|nr:hypothetical protein LUZ60_001085 [Juncus effusus]